MWSTFPTPSASVEAEESGAHGPHRQPLDQTMNIYVHKADCLPILSLFIKASVSQCEYIRVLAHECPGVIPIIVLLMIFNKLAW